MHIEALLGNHPLVAAAAFVEPQDAAPDLRPIAFVVPRGDEELNAVVLRKHLRGHCAERLIPEKIVVLEALPLTPKRQSTAPV